MIEQIIRSGVRREQYMRVFDGHNDSLTLLNRKTVDAAEAFIQGNTVGQMDLPRARQGGLAGGFFAIFSPAPDNSPESDPMYGVELTEAGYRVAERSPIDRHYAAAFTDRIIGQMQAMADGSGGQIEIVRDYPGLEACVAADRLVMILHLEGAEAICSDLSNLDSYYQRGVRSIGLVWSRPNAFGHGVPFRFPASPDTGPGLSEAGKALIRACNEMGILVDLAHLNEQGFWDAAQCSRLPLVVSHADVHAICPSTRNLTDRQIAAVGESGGIIGINFETLNTHPQASIERDVPLTQISDHIDYVVAKAGIDHVGLGSDFDGAEMPLALSDASKLPNLVDTLLGQGYSQGDVEKIAYKNWLRVIEATWKSPRT